MATRLSTTTLDALPESIARPAYDRALATIGIVHLGIGAFHRAHQAVYTDDVLAAGDDAWKIAGVSLQSPRMREEMKPQDGLYTLVLNDGEQVRRRVIGSVACVLFAREQADAVKTLLVAPDTKIVSLTITEKGYARAPASGALLTHDPAIAHDLAHPDAPVSAIGWIVWALETRRKKGIAPFTPLSCDNLPSNGKALRQVVLDFANARSAELGAWIAEHVPFPSTMVDRIVPAPTDEDRAALAAMSGLEDAACVTSEPFTQWVIEDDFVSGRPAWDKAGAIFTTQVEGFEAMKLRLLNAAHSALAYLGYLKGCDTISDCMEDPDLRAYAECLLREEAAPHVAAPDGYDVQAYISALMTRFANTSLRHRCQQIAMDGSQKLPQRLMATIRDRLAQDAPFERAALAVAAWMIYVRGRDLNGQAIDVRDPLADRLAQLSAAHGDQTDGLVGALLGVSDIFAPDLAADPRLRTALTQATDMLLREGVGASLQAIHKKTDTA